MKYPLHIILTSSLFLISNNCISEEWNIKNANKYISDCAAISKSAISSEYKKTFINILEPAEYDAFIQATNEQAEEACQCIVKNVKARYSYQEVINYAPKMLEHAQQIAQAGGECEQNGEELLSKMRAIVNPR